MKPEELSKALKVAAEDINKPGVLVGDAADLIAAGARQRVRIRTGYLQSTIEKRVAGNEAYAEAGAPYAPFVEARYPFMQPALEDVLPQIETMLEDWGDKILEKVANG